MPPSTKRHIHIHAIGLDRQSLYTFLKHHGNMVHYITHRHLPQNPYCPSPPQLTQQNPRLHPHSSSLPTLLSARLLYDQIDKATLPRPLSWHSPKEPLVTIPAQPHPMST